MVSRFSAFAGVVRFLCQVANTHFRRMFTPTTAQPVYLYHTSPTTEHSFQQLMSFGLSFPFFNIFDRRLNVRRTRR